jgi:hypothetical protein
MVPDATIVAVDVMAEAVSDVTEVAVPKVAEVATAPVVALTVIV